jgi:NAD(P)-dependent dehydrogenase (short-subunit alcohol dehydrogenase family)
MGEFDGKTVLITGGGSGIGLATARRLVDAGANVVLAGRRIETLDAAAKDLDSTGERVLAVGTDVSRMDDLDELVDRIRAGFRRLDGIFANAGVAMEFSIPRPFGEADFDQINSINFKGTFFTVQKAVALFDAGGSVVVNGTCAVHRGMTMPMGLATLYAATKAAVANLTRSLVADLAVRGIRINTVSPGFIRTDMLDELLPTEEALEGCRALVPIGRLGRADDVADAVTFLLSARAAYITGEDLSVDGGLASSYPMNVSD